MTATARNALAGETSPYLLQHAGNPVQWYPWGEEAIARARALDRPILLSIGYSACHWCHVMAHESFEDAETAALMNEHFVNVKVDREERPDLDKVYQIAHQLLARRPGGWPLTVFLTPEDLTPFFAGTYFPREARHGLPGFKDLLRHIAAVWRTRRTDIETQNAELRTVLAGLAAPPEGGAATLDHAPLAAARREAAESFDARHGGFGRAPKFPHPGALDRLLRDHAAAVRRGGSDEQALHMALFTLERMAGGGVYDQLGGGFCRYSVDDRWLIPHFEKMLYDNGPLLALYAEAWQVSGRAQLRRVAEQTAAWMLAEMRAPEGGFYSSLDADSEGEEGRYYVWDRAEVEALLEPEERALVLPYFGIDGAPNFEGRWHLYVARNLEDIAAEQGIELERAERLLAAARGKLSAARARRVRPARDDKILTAWNALAIRGLAVAGRILGRTEWIEAATQALDFVRARLWRDGRLLATYTGGRAHLNGYLDDHAFLIEAVLALLEARWRDGELDFAVALAEVLLARFEDRNAGGFFFTSDDHEQVLARLKPFVDDALPAGNGSAAWALQRLGHLLGEARYLEAAERTLRAAWSSIARAPGAHHALLRALEEHLEPTETVVLRGAGGELERWRRRACEHYAPHRQVLAVPAGMQALPGLLAARTATAPVTAYLCRGSRCEAPLDDYRKLDMSLRDTEVRPSDTNQERPR